MQLPLYIVDAFTDRLFHGNPAAVCPLSAWLPGRLEFRIATRSGAKRRLTI